MGALFMCKLIYNYSSFLIFGYDFAISGSLIQSITSFKNRTYSESSL